MKKISLWVILSSFPVFLTSCSNTDELTEETKTTTTLNEVVLKQGLLSAQNNDNEYDSIGILQNHFLDIYFSANHHHTTIEEINEEIQLLIYNKIGLLNIIPSPVEQIIDIINSPESSLNIIISNSHLTKEAKISLTDFIGLLFHLQEQEYEAIHEFIVLYESSIIENALLNNEDKRVILTTSAIARYSFYYARDRKDKDWEISVGNVVAGISGALDDSLAAINMSLVTGISLGTLFTD